MRKAMIYTAVSAAMLASIAVAGIFGPIIVSALLELFAYIYKLKTKRI